MTWLADKFELSRSGTTGNVRPMEGLRGFAVILVFLVHYVTLVEPWTTDTPGLRAISKAMHSMGNSGVDLFFVLSGFLIYGSLIARPQSFLRFISRRIERIYPAFAAVLAIYVTLSFAFPSESKFPTTWWSSGIYFLANYLLLPGLFRIEPIITVAWSLSYEMFFYLAIPLVIAAFNLRKRSTSWRVGLFAFAAIIVLCYCAAFGGHVRLTMFLAGMLLYETLSVYRRSAPSGIGLIALVVGLLFTIPPSGAPSDQAAKTAILACAFFLLCFTCFANPSGALAKAFCWLPLRWLGNMSYSYYLIHGLTLKGSFLLLAIFLHPTAADPVLFWALLPTMFLITLLPSAALFLSVERPLSLSYPRAVRKPVAASSLAARS